MRIGLIGDTHGDIEAWQKALTVFGDIDFAIHTGDILSSGPFNERKASYRPAELAEAINLAPFPTIFAKGNCDAEIDSMAIDFPIQAPYAFIYADNLRILATHGHLYQEQELIEMARRCKVNLVVRGHTHLRGIDEQQAIAVVNPGSASLPHDEDEAPSVGIIEDKIIRILSLNDGIEIAQAEILI